MAGPRRGERFDDSPIPAVNVQTWTFDAKGSGRLRRWAARIGCLPMKGVRDMDVRPAYRVRNRRALTLVAVCAAVALAIPAISLASSSSAPRGITVYVWLSNGVS